MQNTYLTGFVHLQNGSENIFLKRIEKHLVGHFIASLEQSFLMAWSELLCIVMRGITHCYKRQRLISM